MFSLSVGIVFQEKTSTENTPRFNAAIVKFLDSLNDVKRSRVELLAIAKEAGLTFKEWTSPDNVK